LGLFTSVKNLEESYHRAVASEDIAKAVNLCRVFTELAESFLLKMVSLPPHHQPHFALGSLDLVLTCCGHPDYEVPDITFNLWYRLGEELFTRNDDALIAVFRPYVERLLLALCRHCQMEPDSEGVLEEGEDFPEFRARVIDLVKDVAFVVGTVNVCRAMLTAMQGQQGQQGQNNNGHASWEVREASLYIMSAVASCVPDEENECVPQVLNHVLSSRDAHPAVRHSAIKVVGELGRWVNAHPQHLEAILNWILSGLSDNRVSSEAASALQNVCSACRTHMAPHFNSLLAILENMDGYDNLKPGAANGLIKGAAEILSGMPRPQDVREPMTRLSQMQLAPLDAVLKAHEQQQCQQQAARFIGGTDPVTYLDRLAAAFRYVTIDLAPGDDHPCLPAAVEVWPYLQRTFQQYQVRESQYEPELAIEREILTRETCESWSVAAAPCASSCDACAPDTNPCYRRWPNSWSRCTRPGRTPAFSTWPPSSSTSSHGWTTASPSY